MPWYRAVAWAAAQEQLTIDHENLEAFVAELSIDFREGGLRSTEWFWADGFELRKWAVQPLGFFACGSRWSARFTEKYWNASGCGR